jgi:predicted pyridoxine 5'-phosphate oxidase superfamily flavin-nucleotide-binding protein
VRIALAKSTQIVWLLPVLTAERATIDQKHRDTARTHELATVATITAETQEPTLVGARFAQRCIDKP